MSRHPSKPDTRVFIQALTELAPAYGLCLEDSLVETLSAHYGLLVKWNRRLHLTSVIGPTEAARFHYLESLYATHFLSSRGGKLADIGSGAGFPGLPIAAYWPQVDVVLIERRGRRATFLLTASQHLKLKNVAVFQGGFQDYQQNDLGQVVSRAIERFGDTIPQILSWGASAEQIVFYMGKSLASESIKRLGGTWTTDCIAIPFTDQRVLLALSAKRST